MWKAGKTAEKSLNLIEISLLYTNASNSSAHGERKFAGKLDAASAKKTISGRGSLLSLKLYSVNKTSLRNFMLEFWLIKFGIKVRVIDADLFFQLNVVGWE